MRNLIPGQAVITNLSFAVYPQDDFTGQAAIEPVSVFITGNNRQALKNASGYFVFTDLPGNAYTVKIAGKYYGAKEISVDISGLEPGAPLVRVVLKPNYLYPFKAGSTLVRGKVIDEAGHPVPGALIEIMGKDISHISEPDGRFVLYFGPLTGDDIVVRDGRSFVVSDAGTNFTLRITHPGYHTGTVPAGSIEEGKSRLLAAPVTLVQV